MEDDAIPSPLLWWIFTWLLGTEVGSCSGSTDFWGLGQTELHYDGMSSMVAPTSPSCSVMLPQSHHLTPSLHTNLDALTPSHGSLAASLAFPTSVASLSIHVHRRNSIEDTPHRDHGTRQFIEVHTYHTFFACSVQTPMFQPSRLTAAHVPGSYSTPDMNHHLHLVYPAQIGRASCRERV